MVAAGSMTILPHFIQLKREKGLPLAMFAFWCPREQPLRPPSSGSLNATRLAPLLLRFLLPLTAGPDATDSAVGEGTSLA